MRLSGQLPLASMLILSRLLYAINPKGQWLSWLCLRAKIRECCETTKHKSGPDVSHGMSGHFENTRITEPNDTETLPGVFNISGGRSLLASALTKVNPADLQIINRHP